MPLYKGITYELQRSNQKPHGWTWTVHLATGAKGGLSTLRYSAEQNAKRTINKALGQTKTASSTTPIIEF